MEATGVSRAPADPRRARLAVLNPARAAEVEANLAAAAVAQPPLVASALPPLTSAEPPAARPVRAQLRNRKSKSAAQKKADAGILAQWDGLTCCFCGELKRKRKDFAKTQWRNDEPRCLDCSGKLKKLSKQDDDMCLGRERVDGDPDALTESNLKASLDRAKRAKALQRGVTDEAAIDAIRLTKREQRAAEDAAHNAAPEVSMDAYTEDADEDLYDY